jgi:hypothetical protein
MVELLRTSGAGFSDSGPAYGGFARAKCKRFSIGTCPDAIVLGQLAKAIPSVMLRCTACWISCTAPD